MSVFELSVIALWVLLLVVVLLLWAILRRLGEHQKVVGGLSFGPADLRPSQGDALAPMHVHTTDGAHVELADASALAFFSGHCAACRDHAPEFAALAAGLRAHGLRPIAVVDGDPGSAAAVLDGLGPDVEVVLAPFGQSDVLPRLGISTFPGYVAARGGTVVASADSVTELAAALDLPAPAGVAAS